MKSLLVEIGSEEIPAGYIEPALSALSQSLVSMLSNARIQCGNAQTFGTPRRLGVILTDVAEKQEEKTEEVMGPPENVVFNPDGTPKMAAEKFAEKLGLKVSEIRVKETKKGRYLCGDKKEAVSPTRTLLREIIPSVIGSLPFPKTMRWADGDVTFARPIQSLLAIFGGEVVPVSYGDVTSGNLTWGHRFLKPGAIEIRGAEFYESLLKEAFVIADIDQRKKAVKEEIEKAAASVSGTILSDEALVDIVKNLIEYPVAVVGSFDAHYLALPQEILITAMREHQKYFAVADGKGRLLPHFVVVNNTRARDMAVVTRGHEKVLRARLSDAQFFYQGDLQVPVAERVQKLEGVLFQAQLGTMLEKTNRIGYLSAFISDMARLDEELKKRLVRAAAICKADLVSQVVGEFPKLQGVMGRIYATVDNETPDVAQAIEEHYRPTYSGGALPETMTGAILAIADKIDTLCGCFYAGLIPTGASDPYALRRQTIGLIQIIREKELHFSLEGVIRKGVMLYVKTSDEKTADVETRLVDFIRMRLSRLMEEEGFSKDVIASVVSVSIDNIPKTYERVRALENLKAMPDFDPIAVCFKRVVNIIRKTSLQESLMIDEDIFTEGVEKDLHAAFLKTRTEVNACVDQGDYEKALAEISTLREPVDAFFDGVMVMAEEQALRNNRLSLLKEISNLFGEIADFSMIST